MKTHRTNSTFASPNTHADTSACKRAISSNALDKKEEICQ